MTGPATQPVGANIPQEGMYFLANDRVLDWSIAMLESLRSHEPDLPLVMVPFDEQIDALVALSTRYRFSILQHAPLKELDEIGRRFYPTQEARQRLFRKFAVFAGPFERFIFADADIVFLDRIRDVLTVFGQSGMDLLHADEDLVEVYQGGRLRRKMVETYGARGFNTGFWASRRGMFSLEQIDQLSISAAMDAPEFNYGTGEQPFFNYCCDVSRIRYAHVASVVPDLAATFFADTRGIRKSADGKYRVNGRRVPLLHWAGTRANDLMPHRSLFLSHQLRSEPPLHRIGPRLRGAAGSVIGNTIRWARNTGTVNRLYKRLAPAALQRRLTAKLRVK